MTQATRLASTTGAMPRRAMLVVIGASIVTLLLAVIDTNIVTAAAVPIAHELAPAAGTADIPWLVTVYLLAGTSMQPLYGRLADILGVKAVYLGAVGLFLLGSALCGFAGSMAMLIVFRGLQGLGGGGLLSVTMVLIGHLRAEAADEDEIGGNAMAGVMVGFGLVCAPLIGGTVLRVLSWHWIFWVNIPLGLACWIAVATCLRLSHRPVRQPLDLLSGLLIACAAAAVLLGCDWGGQRYPWLSAPELAVAAVALSASAVLVWRQHRSPAPFFPPRLLRHRVLRVVTVLQLATGIGMAAGTVYIVLELQLVRGVSPTATGWWMIPQAVGLALGSWIAGRLLVARRPLRVSVITGTAISAIALGAMAWGATGAPMVVFAGLLGAFGLGVGLTLGNEVIIVQATVDRGDLGIATTGVRFVESLGTSAGAAAIGTVFALAVGAQAGDPRVVAHAVSACFAIGAGVLAVATAVAARLPAGVTGAMRASSGAAAPR